MSYPCVKQHDQSSCGAAALATISLYYKRAINFHQIRDLAGTDQIGTNFLGLKDAAERLGFEAIGVEGEYEEIPEVPLPAVAHVVNADGLGHFVVLFEINKKGVIVADPAHGIEKLTKEEFCQKWTKRLLLLTPRDDFEEAGDGLTKQISPWKRYFQLLLPQSRYLIEIFFAALLITILGLASAFFIQHLVDSVLVHGEKKLLNVLALGMIILILFKSLLGIVNQYLLIYVARKIHLSLISKYLRHALHLPLKFFETKQVGDVLSRVNDATKVNQLISGTTLTVVLNSFLTVIFLGIMYYYDWKLALLVTLFLPFIVGATLGFNPAVKTFSRRAMEQASRLQSYIVENVMGVSSIKALGIEERRGHGADEKLVQTIQTHFSLQKTGLTQHALQTLITGVLGIIVLWYGGYRVFAGELTIGQLMFFNTLLASLIDPLNHLTEAQLSIQDGFVALDRLGEVLDLKAEKLHEPKKFQLEKLQSGIKLENVTFRYGNRGDVLQNVSIDIPLGWKIAIIGESGSGKSTILKLLMRFYDPSEGVVSIDGVDLKDYELASVRSKISLVAQEPHIFFGSIRDNILAGFPNATMEQIMFAAQMADLHDFINELPERYETKIGEGGMALSGGQRQRLAMARAIISDPDIFIFDEATSHLDSQTELTIQKNFKEYLSGKTVISVAHRLSTIRTADWIYVLDKGRVVEANTHEKLLTYNGVYANYWYSQVGKPSPETIFQTGTSTRI